MAVKFGSKPHGALGFPYNAGPSLAAGSALPPLPEIPNTNTRLDPIFLPGYVPQSLAGTVFWGVRRYGARPQSRAPLSVP